jgi:hypothetical protein
MDQRDEARILKTAAGGKCPNCGHPRPDLGTPCPNCGAPALGPEHAAPSDGGRRSGFDALMQVRTSDVEPYTGLRYLSKLFRMIAIILVLLLIAEVVTGLAQQGVESLTTLLAEASRLIVLSALLWGVGDLALLLIDVGHDVRAARILLGRQVAHHMASHNADGSPMRTPTGTTPIDSPAVPRAGERRL